MSAVYLLSHIREDRCQEKNHPYEKKWISFYLDHCRTHHVDDAPIVHIPFCSIEDDHHNNTADINPSYISQYHLRTVILWIIAHNS